MAATLNSPGRLEELETSGDLDPYQAIHIVHDGRIEPQAVCHLAHLARDVADIRHKALPQLRNVFHGLSGEALSEPRDEQRFAVFEAWRFKLRRRRFLHCGLVHFLLQIQLAAEAPWLGKVSVPYHL
jgi:hypothetical protein